jgi:hypothetical protein
MKIKVTELTGCAFNWALAEAGGISAHGESSNPNESMNWAQGGPIIKSIFSQAKRLQADLRAPRRDCPMGIYLGPNPLNTVMLRHIASRLGDEVEVPDDLVEAYMSDRSGAARELQRG